MKRFLNTNSHKGVTLVELAITGAIIGIAALLTQVAVNILTGIQRETGVANINLEAQTIMYEMVRTARSADEIIDATTTKLELRVFDEEAYHYNNSNLFVDSNKGTVIYEFKPAVGGAPSHIERRIDIPSNGGVIVHKLLQNKVLTPDGSNPLFDGRPTTGPPYEYVSIRLRLDPVNFDRGRYKTGNNAPVELSALTMKRTQSRVQS